MRPAILLAKNGWRFDPLSALIGAIIAWVIAGILYARREAIQQLAHKLWLPVANLRERLQSSQEDRYVLALQEALTRLLLFNPQDPQAMFQPPTLLAPPRITSEAADMEEFPPPLRVPFANLLQGHTRLIVAGPLASGRTTTLAMLVWHTIQQSEARDPYTHFPVWVDLKAWKDLPKDKEMSAPEKLAFVAEQFIPNLKPKWLQAHLEKTPSLILVDNWETLSPTSQAEIASWISEVYGAYPNSLWCIATGEQGYGILVERGFVPLTLVPASEDEVIESLYAGWAKLYGQSPDLNEATRYTLHWAQQAGASLLELNMRAVLYLRTQKLPTRLIEVLDHLLDTYIPILDLGEEQQGVAEEARTYALSTLSRIATAHRLEGRTLSRQDVYDFIATVLPPEDERPAKLENTVRKLVQESELLNTQGKNWHPVHYVWEDFLAAWNLVADEVGTDMVKAHLYDPSWPLVLEFYAALGDAAPMVRALLQEAEKYENYDMLLRAARWSVIAPEELAWRKTVIKALAKTFTTSQISQSLRLRIGKNLALSAGEGSRAFFIKALQHPNISVKCAAIRGIGWTGTSQEINLLDNALRQDNIALNESAVQALADMGGNKAAQLLYELLYTTDERLILPIAKALSKISEGQSLLEEAVEAEDLMMRRAAAHGLGQINQPWATELLEKMAREDSEWLVRSAAEAALKAREEQSKAKTVVLSPPKIDEIDWLIAWAASQGMGLGVGKAAARMLLRAVVEGDARTKILGALTLTYIGNMKYLELLEPLLDHEDPGVRQAARHAIAHIEQRYHVYQGV